MNHKTICTSLVIVIVLLTITLMACTNSVDTESPVSTPQAPEVTTTPQSPVSTSQPTEIAAAPQASSSAKTGRLEVVYFHRANRCKSCIYAEDATRHTIDTYFGTELASGELAFIVLNLQDEANVEMVEKYDAHSSSLFINEIKDGSDNIKGIPDIWTKIGRDEAFTEVVKTAIEEHLGNI